jgi:hypothetical protein
MGYLYVKRRAADYRGENIENIKKNKNEMVDTYMKLYFEYVIDGKLPPTDSYYYQICQHYIEHSVVEPVKNISLIIDW